MDQDQSLQSCCGKLLKSSRGVNTSAGSWECGKGLKFWIGLDISSQTAATPFITISPFRQQLLYPEVRALGPLMWPLWRGVNHQAVKPPAGEPPGGEDWVVIVAEGGWKLCLPYDYKTF